MAAPASTPARSATSAPERRSEAPRSWWLRQLLEALAPCLIFALVIYGTSSGFNTFIWTTVVIYALFAMGTNLLFGWAGVMSFGQAAFFGAGAYLAGILREESWPPLLMLVAAGALGVAAAIAFGAFALRTPGLRFAVLTLVFAQLVYLVAFNTQSLGGETGLFPVTREPVLGFEVTANGPFFCLVVAVFAVIAVLLRRLYRSSFGAALAAARDGSVRAASLGIPVRRLQLIAFALAGGIAAIAGTLFAYQQGSVSPSVLNFHLSATIILICLLGGRHRFWGPAVGAIVYVWAEQLLTGRTDAPDLFIGLLLLFIVLVAPEGLARFPADLYSRFRRTA